MNSHRTLAILGHHGGSGRTTTALLLTRALRDHGIDAACEDRSGTGIAKELWPAGLVSATASRPDVLVVDAPLVGDPLLDRALSGVDEVLITLRPSLASLRGAGNYNAIFEDLEAELLGVVFTNHQAGDALERQLIDMVRRLEPDLEFSAPIMQDPAVAAWSEARERPPVDDAAASGIRGLSAALIARWPGASLVPPEDDLEEAGLPATGDQVVLASRPGGGN